VVKRRATRYSSIVRAVLHRLRAVPAILAIVGAGVVSLPTAIARAEPVVVVHVRRHGTERADATVVIRNAEGVVGTCRTEDGTCEIRGVPPGRHTVSAQGADGSETPGRPVLIPPDGKVSLIVAVP
jgi:hypothetical protein